ncbi:ornithine cyclodeaminase family protein [Azospirillum rugosum]|uniref:Ornithine cyclodeaminase n=1 Tax=Azospirillum rugosum TaxID=416170 RepID=A0ABS4SLA0_9PROT|nr:ornithine cyclodeaminase family protein [Azospirillum rugosum]MBP2293341.1 ornithine cyclodeaminase [Azospirillum rugosum]
MTEQPIWLTEAEVAALVPLNAGIEALRYQLPREFGQGARNLNKVLATWEPRSSMHNLGSIDPEQGVGGIKSWINTPAGARAVYVLFDTRAGAVLAIMDAATLGALRTAGISGLATAIMAAPDADSLSIIGTGRQAFAQVAAVSTVRPLRRIHVYSPTEANKLAFCEKLRQAFEAEIVAEPDLPAAVGAAPILTVVTRAREPFITGAMLRAGTHVNAVGAILPANAELMPDVFDRIDGIVVDNVPNARIASAELKRLYGDDEAAWAALPTIGQLIGGQMMGGDGFVRNPGRITCFKAMGMGLSDLAIAVAAHRAARKRGLGRPLGEAEAGSMTWTAMPVAAPRIAQGLAQGMA